MQSPFSFHRPVRCGRAWRIGLVMTLLACSCAPEMPGSPARPTRPVGIASDATSPAGISDQIVVTLAPGADPEVLANDYGATLVSACEGFATLRFSGDLALAEGSPSLAGDARVLSAEPDAWLESPETRQESFAFDDGLGSEATYLKQPAASAIGLPAAHLISTGRDVRVAILDTGADLSHPALAGRIAGGWDFVSGDADPTDTPDGVDNDQDGRTDEGWGHGTHVAGIVALAAPAADLLIERVLDAEGRGDIQSVAAGIMWAVEHGAKVINLSLGMLRPSPAIEYALQNAVEHGVVVVASAGNSGSEFPREYPAASVYALAIGAVDAMARPASFTSYGFRLDLCAPGVGVRSAFPGGGYLVWSGTSMSAPFVAGTVALLLELHPRWKLDQVLARLTRSAVPLVDVSPEQSGKLGAGALNAAAALEPPGLPVP